MDGGTHRPLAVAATHHGVDGGILRLDPLEQCQGRAILRERGGHADDGVLLPVHLFHARIEERRRLVTGLPQAFDVRVIVVASVLADQHVFDVPARIWDCVTEQIACEDPVPDQGAMRHGLTSECAVELQTHEVGKAEIEVEHIAWDAIAGKGGLQEAHRNRRAGLGVEWRDNEQHSFQQCASPRGSLCADTREVRSPTPSLALPIARMLPIQGT